MKNKTSAASSASSRSYEAGVVGMPIHRPETAKAYFFKSFMTRIETSQKKESNEGPYPSGGESTPQSSNVSRTTPKKKTLKATENERDENVARLLGAIRMLYESWSGHLSAADLDQRAWNWYAAVRPEVESGPSGWGAKGHLHLSNILALRRKDT